jgi:hypothetical protein
MAGGCGTLTPTGTPAATPTPSEVVRITLPSTGTLPGQTLLARLSGRVFIDPASRCVYAVQAGGAEVNIWWPVGFNATVDPFVVYNSRGMVIARDGEPVEFTGGVVTDDQIPLPPGCDPRGRVWLVGGVAR